MRYARNENGMALVMSLVLAVVTLAFSAALIFMVTQGSKMSGLEKRYASALDAAKGGVEVVLETIDKGGQALSGVSIPKPDCLEQKIFSKTAWWNLDDDDPDHLPLGDEGQYCKISDKSAMSDNPKDQEDMLFNLGEYENTYRIYIKIVDTVAGNIRPVKGGVRGAGGDVDVNQRGGEITVGEVVGGGAQGTPIITPMTIPYLYSVLVFSERIDPDTNKAKGDATAMLRILYAH